MELQVIGTGSSGNAYVLKAGGQSLLLDAGLPIKAIMRAIPDWNSLVGCLVTHEHGDHAKAAIQVANMGIPVTLTQGTRDKILPDGCLTALNVVKSAVPFVLGEFTIQAFETQHDAAEPCGYLIRHDPTGETALYATDTYYLRYTFPRVNFWLVECNYIDEIIDEQQEDGEIGAELRNRLKKSHMSLRRLLDVFRANDLTKTRAIVLVHLSDGRSNERVMVETVKHQTGIDQVIAAAAGMDIPLTLSPF